MIKILFLNVCPAGTFLDRVGRVGVLNLNIPAGKSSQCDLRGDSRGGESGKGKGKTMIRSYKMGPVYWAICGFIMVVITLFLPLAAGLAAGYGIWHLISRLIFQ